jgi:N-methylhydantoinase B
MQGTILAGWDAVRGRYFVNYENFAGGQGALPARDGDDAMHVSMSNTSNLPIEAMEMEFPLRAERYELIPGSGGAGRRRGGLGVCRDYRIIADGVELATRSTRQRFPAAGLAELLAPSSSIPIHRRKRSFLGPARKLRSVTEPCCGS